MKLWQKDYEVLQEIEKFTVGRDREMDAYLAQYDVLGSLAHIRMLCETGLLEDADFIKLNAALQGLYREALDGNLKIEEGVEDIHSQVEAGPEMTRSWWISACFFGRKQKNLPGSWKGFSTSYRPYPMPTGMF